MTSDATPAVDDWQRLQTGTFIIPSTGQRARRQLSLRTPALQSDPPSPNTFVSVFSRTATAKDRARALIHNVAAFFRAIWAWILSPNGKAVLKCSFAYLLGTMGTFCGPLADLLGRRDGKHIVATITVYFHPARTVGSMLEAILIALIAVVYGQLMSLLAMGTSVLLDEKLEMVVLSRLSVLVLYIGGGLGFVGWVKQKFNRPLINTACTLTSIAIISSITKEEVAFEGQFSTEANEQVLRMLFLGILITATVNVLVWRTSARRDLQKSLSCAVVNLGDMLSMITRGFLNGSEDEVNSEHFTNVSSQYESARADMSTSLRESKFEYYLFGGEKQYSSVKAIVKTIENLSHAVGGLRTACDTQFVLLKETPFTDVDSLLSPRGTGYFPRPGLTRTVSSFLRNTRERVSALEAITESSEGRSTGTTTPVMPSEQPISPRTEAAPEPEPANPVPVFRTPSDIFEVFILRLGPSMKSLAYTLSEILRDPPFVSPAAGGGFEILVNENFKPSLLEARALFDNSRAGALEELYDSLELDRSRSEKIQADIEEVAAACSHFSYSLQCVAEDIETYLDALDDFKFLVGTDQRSWGWLRFWRRFWRPRKRAPADAAPLDGGEGQGLLAGEDIPVVPLRKSAVPRGIPDEMLRQRDNYSWDASPSDGGFTKRLSQVALRYSRFLTRDDILFGTKVGIGAIVWAAAAFIPSTRPIYKAWRGEWGLLSYMIVIATTVGASNTTSLGRFRGTVAGAVCALVGWLLSDGDVYLLAFFGWLMSLYNFYITFELKNPQMGRTTLLAWNIMILYAYSLARELYDDDDDDLDDDANPLMFDIVFHRFVAVTLGIIWGMVVCRFIWPLSGRKKFREGMSVLYLQLGLIWKRGPLAVLLRGDNPGYLRSGEQAALRRYALKLDTLRKAAESEFSLRGPFPKAPYARIMASTTRILDGFHAMSLATTRHGPLSPGERALLRFTAPERAVLCDRICHVCQVVASSVMLEYPLTDAIPSVTGVKDRLLGKVYQMRKRQAELEDEAEGRGEGSGAMGVGGEGEEEMIVVKERDFALVYIYTLLTAQVADELGKVIAEVEGLFGVLSSDSSLLQ
ncbi:related to Lactobacillus putative histidine protein kinase SppK [Cephalotrichum gorgonifer]|uniref:Related to Lactobacillus putative histidine protein kinase SppK n=1 Tax=Cephalotrichum gorgonifer TaxID=2041049 RepID=A0AAE8N789_9PEZI|nr:related to Lactobacillus putative histidine protein kinase SppK [Cephalotrichum gorgonifer]